MLNNMFLISFVLIITSNLYVFAGQNSNERDSKELPPCRACRTFTDSFNKGLERTKKGQGFGGGDTAWEEKNLGSYATSEIRLTEIQEKLCSDISEGKNQCYRLLEEFDEHLETWWFHKQTSHPNIFEYFCIETGKKCCPEGHFGENCTACPGFPNQICSKNGKCKGDGTRKGSGQCACDEGYSGQLCEACSEHYFASYKDETKILCSKCHQACEGTCNKAGPTGCEKCAAGWIQDEVKGCLDVNECAAPKSPCSPLQFCVNNDGSFKCLDCDRSCLGCTGDGPDMCKKCAPGYVLQDNMCLDSEQESRKQHVYYTRYSTYLGLCIATFIIFNKNMIAAALIGFIVAVYIAVSEYMLNLPPTPKTDHLAEQIMSQLK